MRRPVLPNNFRIALRWILWVLLVQLVLVNISAAIYAYRNSRVYDDPGAGTENYNSNIFTKTWHLFCGPRMPRSLVTERPVFSCDTVALTTSGNLRIDAWYSRTDSSAKGTILLFHGTRDNKGMLLSEASEFRQQGYNILLVDFRACGNSGGNVTTIGSREAEEVKLAFNFIRQKGEKKIILWGNSMGAVAVTRAIFKYGLKTEGVILEMPFLSLRSYLRARAQTLGFRGSLQGTFSFLVTAWMGLERGFNGFSHNTSRYAAKVECPVLLQWGNKDEYVEEYETDGVFKALASKHKRLVVYENAGHESLLNHDPLKWRKEVGRFLEQDTR